MEREGERGTRKKESETHTQSALNFWVVPWLLANARLLKFRCHYKRTGNWQAAAEKEVAAVAEAETAAATILLRAGVKS